MPAFADVGGPRSGKPTALDIVQREGMTGKLRGKTALITGCSRGSLGYETALALATTGCHLFLTIRDPAKADEIVTDLLESSSGSDGNITLLPLELDSLFSVRQCAMQFLDKKSDLHILILHGGELHV